MVSHTLDKPAEGVMTSDMNGIFLTAGKLSVDLY